jgi:peroxiredoxin
MKENFLDSEYISTKKVLIFGINRIQSRSTILHIKKINKMYNQLIATGIDDVFCVSFCDFLLFDFLMPKFSTKIKFFQDKDDLNLPNFQKVLKKRGHKNFLKKFWQFVFYIDNGLVKFYIEEPFPIKNKLATYENTSQNIYTSVDPEIVLKKLKNN